MLRVEQYEYIRTGYRVYGLSKSQPAKASACDPNALTRAARDMEESRPDFAMQAGLAALHWLVEGYGYEITNLDVRAAFEHSLKAADNAGRRESLLTIEKRMCL